MIPLRVRRLTENDVHEVNELIDDETAKLTDLNVPFMEVNAYLFVNSYLTYGAWHNNKLVGAFQLRSDGEVSYLVHKDYRQKSIATEMLYLAKRIARKEYKLNTLYCRVRSNNIPSIRTAEKLGFDVYHDK